MKKRFFLMGIVSLTIGVSACNNSHQKSGDNPIEITAMSGNAQISLDWAGIYTGVLPCADCSGIQTTVELKGDETYRMTVKYLGKEENAFETMGTFTWNEAGNTITFDNANENGGFATQYFVGENTLTQLDIDGNFITGELADSYVLVKQSEDIPLVGTHWKLIEINGQAVTDESGNANEPFITFNAEGQVFGNGGCNSFRGPYELGGGDRLSFPKPLAATMMMCLNMGTEDQFMRMFEQVDSYAIKGDMLSLNRARMAPLARFAAVQETAE